MFENEIQDFLEKLRTRREFLKLSGRGIATLTVSAAVLNLFGCSPVGESANVLLTAKGMLISEQNRCVGCQRCEMVCSAINDGKIHPFVSRVKIARNFNYGTEISDNYRNVDGYFGNFLMTPETCKQCQEPKCAGACPVEAISLSETLGAWTIDAKKCVGCGACAEACPWHMPTIDPDTKKSTKCILCGACAENCITGALRIIPWEEVTAILNKKGYRFS